MHLTFYRKDKDGKTMIKLNCTLLKFTENNISQHKITSSAAIAAANSSQSKCKMNNRKSAISSTNHSGVAANIIGTSSGNFISVFGSSSANNETERNGPKYETIETFYFKKLPLPESSSGAIIVDGPGVLVEEIILFLISTLVLLFSTSMASKKNTNHRKECLTVSPKQMFNKRCSAGKVVTMKKGADFEDSPDSECIVMMRSLTQSANKLTCKIKPSMNYRVYSKKIDEILPKNLLEDIYTAAQQKQLGVIYDKRPFKITLEKDKKYNWCSCGMSRQQPFCDGTHKNQKLRITMKPVQVQLPSLLGMAYISRSGIIAAASYWQRLVSRANKLCGESGGVFAQVTVFPAPSLSSASSSSSSALTSPVPLYKQSITSSLTLCNPNHQYQNVPLDYGTPMGSIGKLILIKE
ncbi:hypothetical protein AGLY_005791 [Aphis glycines]|uniref:Iron-binding zinc finger CDGSH type domain-containing protein n=1 Tax=Aphis glycines TaxID=307491 RepID=A0A6G0TT68_APHGL|nr:hypothetical protein AGLY_005791 [Aphis glycines]